MIPTPLAARMPIRLGELEKTRALLETLTQTDQAQGDLCIGVANNELGVHITIMQKHSDGSATLIYSAKAPAGDSCGLASLVPKTEV
jgi:hypothetical protein